MKTIKIGPIDQLILFGGGRLVVEFALAARRRKLKVCVFAVKRHLEEAADYDTGVTLKKLLETEKVPYYLTQDVNRSAELKRVTSPRSLGLGLGEAYTFKEKTIALFSGNLFDFMVIDLPRYRGGAHFTWQILRADRWGSWNIQRINKEMIPGVFDSGEIVKSRRYSLRGAKIPRDYFERAHREGLILFKEFLLEVQKGHSYNLAHLDERQSLFLPRLYTPKQGFIDWSENLEEIYRFVSAFDEPYPGAATFLGGKKVYLKDATKSLSNGRFHPFMSGLIYRINQLGVWIAVKDGTLLVKEVSRQGENIIEDLTVGQRFFTPCKFLEEAKLFQADYDTEGLRRKK